MVNKRRVSTFPVTRARALELVRDRLRNLPDRTEERTAHGRPPTVWFSRFALRPGNVSLSDGDEVSATFGPRAPAGSWVAFADLWPGRLLPHSCIFFFVDANEEVRDFRADCFPSDLEEEYRLELTEEEAVRSMTVPTVDIAVTVAGRELLLIKRAKPPFLDKLVLPGGHVEPSDASPRHACAREAEEEIGLRVDPTALVFLGRLGRPGRDPRPGHEYTIVYTIDVPNREALQWCRAGSDARALSLRLLASLTPDELGFDHMDAVSLLRERHAS